MGYCVSFLSGKALTLTEERVEAARSARVPSAVAGSQVAGRGQMLSSPAQREGACELSLVSPLHAVQGLSQRNGATQTM